MAFEPKAPPLERRWQAIAAVKAAGLPVGICVTPMLPLENPDRFLEVLHFKSAQQFFISPCPRARNGLEEA